MAAAVMICGDCWYKESDSPPDKRETLATAVKCSICHDPVTEVVVLKAATASRDDVVAPDEIDEDQDPADYKIVIEWERTSEKKEYYTFTISDPDADDLQYVRNGDFDEIAWDVAYEASEPQNVEDYEDLGFSDDGPSAISFVVKAK